MDPRLQMANRQGQNPRRAGPIQLPEIPPDHIERRLERSPELRLHELRPILSKRGIRIHLRFAKEPLMGRR
jgi:hypothetical protein